jgi:regulator of ribonuclease activity A
LRDEDDTAKVAVVDVGRAYYAVVGENLMKFAHNNNYAGIVVNGYIRDAFQIRDIPVALYALGSCPRKYIPVTRGERHAPLSFGDIVFNSRDYLYADSDGVIVSPGKLL